MRLSQHSHHHIHTTTTATGAALLWRRRLLYAAAILLLLLGTAAFLLAGRFCCCCCRCCVALLTGCVSPEQLHGFISHIHVPGGGRRGGEGQESQEWVNVLCPGSYTTVQGFNGVTYKQVIKALMSCWGVVCKSSQARKVNSSDWTCPDLHAHPSHT